MGSTGENTLGRLEGAEQPVVTTGGRSAARDEPGGDLQSEIWGLVLLVFSLIVLLSLISYSAADLGPTSGARTSNWIGPVGAAIAHVFLTGIGLVAFPMVLTASLVGMRLLRSRRVSVSGTSAFGYLGAGLSLATLLQLVAADGTALGHVPGGSLGL